MQQFAPNPSALTLFSCIPHPPQRWNSKPFSAEAANQFNAERKRGLRKVFFHGVYLINLASPDSQQFHLSKSSLIHYLNLNAGIKGDGVIFHVGSLRDQSDERIGYRRAAEGINFILEKAIEGSPLLLEVAAGGGAVIGDHFEELAEIYELVEQKQRVGFALDTQHMWASGYDIDQGLDQVVDQADRILGLSKIKAIHLNDSKTEKGSRRDRHENLGDGLIGLSALANLVNHPRLKHLPFILETPSLKTPETACVEVEKLRRIMKR